MEKTWKNGPAAKMNEFQTLQEGQLFAEVYKIVRRIGQGAKGTVYLAEHTLLAMPVALKVFPPEILADPDASRRFQNEAKAIARLTHENIVKAQAAGVSSGNVPYIATEFIEGKTLEDMLQQPPGFLRTPELLRTYIQILEALEYAHDNGLVHRDLKPSNIMITSTGSVKLLDFGIAKFVGSNQQDKTATSLLIGSPAYMSPEQAGGKPVDLRADIYALGVMLFRCVSGKLPFVAETDLMVMYQHQNTAPPALILPYGTEREAKQLNDIASKCLAKNPADRFQSAGDLKEALHQLLTNTADVTEKESNGVPLQSIVLWTGFILLSGLFLYSMSNQKQNATTSVATTVATAPEQPRSRFSRKRLQAELADARESSHRTKEGVVSLQNNDAATLVWRARNFYHSSEHNGQTRERLDLCNKAIETYDKVLSLLKKSPEKYLYYLSYVGKARALGVKLQSEGLLGAVPEDRKSQIYQQRLDLLRKAAETVPKNSYETSVISREQATTLMALNNKAAAADAFYVTIKLRENLAEWSPDSVQYIFRNDFKEDDSPTALLDAYHSLAEIERERKNEKAAMSVEKRLLEMAKNFSENACEETHMSQLLGYPIRLAQQGKKQEALEALQDLLDIADQSKKVEDKLADWIKIADIYNKFGDSVTAIKLIDATNKELDTLTPNERLNTTRILATQLRKKIKD